MQRLPTFLPLLAAMLVAAACAQQSTPPPAAPPDTSVSAPAPPSGPGRVNVSVQCGDKSHATAVAVAPWIVRPDGNRVTWQIHGSKLDSIEVRATDPKHWPFPRQSFGSRGRSLSDTLSAALLRKLQPGREAETYHYTIVLICPLADTTRTITIDPDVMVGT